MKRQFDYDAVLGCWRLLADKAYDHQAEMIGGAVIDFLYGPDAFLEEATEKLLLLTDELNYDDIVGDGQLTEPAMLIAQLEGWCVRGRAQAGDLAIQTYDNDVFDSNEAALAFVRQRAHTDEPGTKLHQIALSLVEDIA